MGDHYNIIRPNGEAMNMTFDDEPELQLLVIDLGDSCVVKVESGKTPFENMIPSTGATFAIFNNEAQIFRRSFDAFRAAIDALEGDKPVPRIEHVCDETYEILGLLGQGQGTIEHNALESLNLLAGKPLPVWTPRTGTWKELTNSKDCTQDELPRVWRFTLTEGE